jgi:signal transduction histidine kinase
VAFEASDALENALINQKGFVSYFFLDRNPEWLERLGVYRQVFANRLADARRLAASEQERGIVERIAFEYDRYIDGKDRVIHLYRTGRFQEGVLLHPQVRERFFKILDLCEAHKRYHKDRIVQQRHKSHLEARRLRLLAGVAVASGVCLGVALILVLVRRVFMPLIRLAEETGITPGGAMSRNMVEAIGSGIRGLKAEYQLTHSELEQSREHLLQAEKMALVGKLAAGMAHSIRNPFTSVKMRLFSLGRSLELSRDQSEDFQVISEEIRHIDTIVQNFLEFSRPPKLVMQPISPSVVIDQVLQLLAHRLKSYDVTVSVRRHAPLPDIVGDPEQLKEVFVNIIINACEAIQKSGRIQVTEETTEDPHLGPSAVVRIADNGPGMAPAVASRVFAPFFTTKAEGTGLGLSIAARIVEEHRGRLEVESTEGQGTVFILRLSLAHGDDGARRPDPAAGAPAGAA